MRGEHAPPFLEKNSLREHAILLGFVLVYSKLLHSSIKLRLICVQSKPIPILIYVPSRYFYIFMAPSDECSKLILTKVTFLDTPHPPPALLTINLVFLSSFVKLPTQSKTRS